MINGLIDVFPDISQWMNFFSKQDRWAVLPLSSRIPFLIAGIKYVSDAQEGWLGST